MKVSMGYELTHVHSEANIAQKLCEKQKSVVKVAKLHYNAMLQS
jgi:hypothetical protein